MIRTRSEKKSLSVLIRELDGLFSEWLRRSNQIDGKCRCFICSASGRWQDMQAMHFVDRDQMSLRFDPNNVYVGCEDCNCYDPNHHERFEAAIFLQKGKDILDYLEMKKRSLQKWMPYELQERIDLIKEQLKKLK